MQASFKREIESIGKVHAFVRDFFGHAAIDEAYLFAIDLAVEEIFTNVVKYNAGGSGEIEIELERREEELAIAVTDPDCDPFDITRAERVDTERPLRERPIGGLGIHLVKSLMDEIDYAYEQRRGTVRLVKRIR